MNSLGKFLKVRYNPRLNLGAIFMNARIYDHLSHGACMLVGAAATVAFRQVKDLKNADLTTTITSIGCGLIGLLAWYAFSPSRKVDSDRTRVDQYLELLLPRLNALGPLGDAAKGEIEILDNREEILKCEKATDQKVGILAQNKWQMWIADPVRFPNGKPGVYGRFLWKSTINGASAAVTLPILPDGKILFVCTYRHALRDWRVELPRGNGLPDETVQKTAQRELGEETGAIGEVSFLGRVDADSGLTSGNIPIYEVAVKRFKEVDREDAETGMFLHPMSTDEVEEAIQRGYAVVKFKDGKKNVPFQDGFTLSAYTYYKSKCSAQQDDVKTA